MLASLVAAQALAAQCCLQPVDSLFVRRSHRPQGPTVRRGWQLPAGRGAFQRSRQDTRKLHAPAPDAAAHDLYIPLWQTWHTGPSAIAAG